MAIFKKSANDFRASIDEADLVRKHLSPSLSFNVTGQTANGDILLGGIADVQKLLNAKGIQATFFDIVKAPAGVDLVKFFKRGEEMPQKKITPFLSTLQIPITPSFSDIQKRRKFFELTPKIVTQIQPVEKKSESVKMDKGFRQTVQEKKRLEATEPVKQAQMNQALKTLLFAAGIWGLLKWLRVI